MEPSTSARQLVTHSPTPAFRIRSMGYSAGASMLSSSCRWSSATAKAGRNRPFSSQISPDQGIAVHVAVTTGRRELTETLPPTRNATAQPGSSWLRLREAFLPLARSYRIKGMPRASLHCRGRRGRHCREDCDGATARRRQRAAITLVSRAVRCHPEK